MTYKEAIEILKAHGSIYDCCKEDHEVNEAIHLAIKALEARPQGEWIYKDFDEETGIKNSYFCSKCDCPQSQVYINFCGNCGADMRGNENDC